MPAPFVRFHRNYLLCGDTAIVPPAVFCTAVCRGGRLCPPCSFFTHVCRGRCPHRPSFPVFTGTASFAETPQLLLRRPTFSVAPEKVGKKRRRRRVILRADAREFLAAPRPERPIRAQNCYFPDSLLSQYCLQVCRSRCRRRPLQRFAIERKYSAPSANS